tara:strand:+ start:3294 stop:3872 length:579 start_codon:yes stop_codon:yes gene_type:complete
MKFKIFKFENVTSTNDIAISLIRKKNKENGCVYAKKQTKGRGTRGKKWISRKGNFFGTIFFPLKSNYPPFNEFAIINPVILSEVIRHFCSKKNISVKWPNDIFVDGKKICGILQELIISKGKKFLIIGIGLNIISNPDIKNKYQATNILLESKKRPSIKMIIQQITYSYERFFLNLNSYKYTAFKKKAETMY